MPHARLTRPYAVYKLYKQSLHQEHVYKACNEMLDEDEQYGFVHYLMKLKWAFSSIRLKDFQSSFSKNYTLKALRQNKQYCLQSNSQR